MTTDKQVFQTKIDRVHAARIRAEAFVNAGGDPKSKQGAPIGEELFEAFKDLSTEFGYSIRKEQSQWEDRE
jgi:hypothetical protein